MTPVLLDGERLTLEDVARVARHGETVALDPAARPKVEAARHVIEAALAAERSIYGVSTGFGPLSDVFVGAVDRDALQRNLLRSHAAGIGDPIGEPETRATILLRANVLAKGHSGVRPEIIELLCELLNREVHPIIPERGSFVPFDARLQAVRPHPGQAVTAKNLRARPRNSGSQSRSRSSRMARSDAMASEIIRRSSQRRCNNR